jgi:hypothetical protein
VFKVTSPVFDRRETDRNNENLWLAMTLAFTSFAEQICCLKLKQWCRNPSYRETSAVLTMQIKSKVWRLYNTDKLVTQLAMENDHKFNVPPAYFGQAGPSSRETCKIQNRNCLKLSIKTATKCTFLAICNLKRRNILFFSLYFKVYHSVHSCTSNTSSIFQPNTHDT